MTEESLNDADIGPTFEQMGRKLWRSACGVAAFLMPAASAVS